VLSTSSQEEGGRLEESGWVSVLVGERSEEGRFAGFRAQFQGREIASYTDARGGCRITYTLYRCTAYQYEAYRVHVADESDPRSPRYELHPSGESTGLSGVSRDYSEPFDKRQAVDAYPIFARDLEDAVRSMTIDPLRRF
jgi:hypothetical protein